MVIYMHYKMTLDFASEGNFKTRSPQEANRLIENFMSNNITRNEAMSSMISDGCMDEMRSMRSNPKLNMFTNI